MTINETTAIIGIIVLLIGNVVGMLLAIRNSGKKEGGNDQKMKELIEKVSALPCVKDPNYMVSTGELRGIVKTMSDQFRQMSENLAAMNSRLDHIVDKSKDN
jgi:hypothetical protein